VILLLPKFMVMSSRSPSAADAEKQVVAPGNRTRRSAIGRLPGGLKSPWFHRMGRWWVRTTVTGVAQVYRPNELIIFVDQLISDIGLNEFEVKASVWQ
jgi:hypothetical protein